jgi:hypothetical protein
MSSKVKKSEGTKFVVGKLEGRILLERMSPETGPKGRLGSGGSA